jgi:hypothetical protein
MAAISTAILLGSLALTAAGTAIGVKGSMAQAKASEKAEDNRKAQMTLDASRQRREAIRQGIVARSQALFNANNQGAEAGSGLPGGYGQIQGETGRQTTAINQNEQIGANIFSANKDFYKAQGVVAFGSGLAGLGQTVLSNLGPLTRLGNYAAGGFGAGSAGGYVSASGAPVPGRNPF